MLSDPGPRLGEVYAALVATLLAAAVLRLAPTAREVLVGIVVAAGSVALTSAVSSAVGLLGWAFYTGFVENHYGVLTFASVDLLRLSVLVAVAVLVARGTARAARWWSCHRGSRSATSSPLASEPAGSYR
jgi:hypothetical protein